MLQKFVVLMCCGMFLFSGSVNLAVAGSNDELLKKIEQLERQLKELKQVQKSSSEKMEQCMKAIGVEKLCSCLKENLSDELTFEQYVHNVVSTRQELGYDAMAAEQRKKVDNAVAARDACVEKEKEKGGFLW
jgi:hypothetical protein